MSAISQSIDDFILSRKAMRCSPKTLATYQSMLGRFARWLEAHGIQSPDQLTPRSVRAFLAELQGKAWTLNGYGRAIRTLLRFWHEEGYLPQAIKVKVPSVPKQRLPFLTADQVKTVLRTCDLREKALILFMIDSGLRRQEVCNLNIGDVDPQTGAVRVIQGKGKKDRLAAIGSTTRHTLLAYLDTAPNKDPKSPLFQTVNGKRFTGDGIQSLFRRLSRKVGFKVTAHMLRRSFATFALRLGMDIVSLQALLGHSSIETTRHYIQLLDDDILAAHHKASPADKLQFE